MQVHAAECALGLLDGADRAAVIAHIESCEACRALVDELSRVTDSLVLLAPHAEPPAGFERRVMQRLGSSRPSRKVVIGAAAAAILLVLGGFALGRTLSSERSDVQTVTMRTPSGRVVGEAYLHRGSPSWVYVSVPDWRADQAYELRVSYADGQTSEVTGDGTWNTLLDAGRSIHRLELVDADGQTWCTADV